MAGYRIYGDWGTTHLRLWRIENGAVTATLEGPGVSRLIEPPLAGLRRAAAAWLHGVAPQQIVLCGMAGSRGGLHEVAYAPCPVDANAWRAHAADFSEAGLSVRIAAGVACRDPDGRPDVMRGEETQVFGALRREPTLGRGRHHFVLPGTHSKWVTVEDGSIDTVRTFVTGELFARLQGSSLLAATGERLTKERDEGFAEGLERAADGRPLGSLFEARAAQLRDDRSAEWAEGFVSGLLIGGELAEAHQLNLLPNETIVIGGPTLIARYAAAFKAADITATLLDGDTCAQAGLELLDDD